MIKIDKLTDEQQAKIHEYWDLYFDRATCTEPADRPRAEAAARRLAEIGGVKIIGVVWVTCPDCGKEAYEKAWASLSDSLRASLSDSLSASLGASLRASLSASLSASLRDSLWASLSDSLWASLRASLSASLSASLWDSPIIAFYSFGRDVLSLKYSWRYSELLHLYGEIQASCFALWIVPGKIILCERPSKCEIVDRKLIGIEWRK